MKTKMIPTERNILSKKLSKALKFVSKLKNFQLNQKEKKEKLDKHAKAVLGSLDTMKRQQEEEEKREQIEKRKLAYGAKQETATFAQLNAASPQSKNTYMHDDFA